MTPHPGIGIIFHWLGGLASASFYVPFRAVKSWSWETAWLIGGVFSWLIAPIVIASIMTKDLFRVLLETPSSTLFWCYTFGILWGFGGLTFGLTMRYLGMSLGMALALGYCAVFGTLVPPIFAGSFVNHILKTRSGIIILTGVCVCLCGIILAGMAGVSKEKDFSAEGKISVIREFNLRKGFLVATFCGIMSACFSFGLAAGEPIRALSLKHGTPVLWGGLPTLIVVLLGGFTTNAIWCLTLNVRNRTSGEYFSGMAQVPLWRNYAFSGCAGVTWYMQFFFYTMGEIEMGPYGFSSWTLHMASIMIFGSLWGLALKEWKGAGPYTMRLLACSLAVLVASTLVVGYGNYLATTRSALASATTASQKGAGAP